jgi:uncharacterized protein (TIGR00251 family)
LSELLSGWHIKEDAAGVRFKVRLTPRSSREAVGGLYGDALKVSVRAPAVDGKANQALIRLLSKRLRVPPSRVVLVSGAASRAKVLQVAGLSLAEVRAALGYEDERQDG